MDHFPPLLRRIQLGPNDMHFRFFPVIFPFRYLSFSAIFRTRRDLSNSTQRPLAKKLASSNIEKIIFVFHAILYSNRR